MPSIKLNHGLRRLEVTGIELENNLIFDYFHRIPADQRDSVFAKALHIGVLALSQERLSAFLARTENELGTELESLKIRFDMSTEIFSKSSMKGIAGEIAVAEYLGEFLAAKDIRDTISPTGNVAGALAKNKTGDILCSIDDGDDRSIVIECKFDKTISLGDPNERDWYGKNIDTALNQLLEAQVNRRSAQAIIVFDRSSINPSLLKRVDNVAYRAGFGFIVVIDMLHGDFSNLGLAYLVARDLAVADRQVDLDTNILDLLIGRVVSEINRLSDIRKLIERNIKNCEEVLGRIDQSMLSIEFCRSYLAKFLSDGILSKEDLLVFATGGDLKARYQLIATELANESE